MRLIALLGILALLPLIVGARADSSDEPPFGLPLRGEPGASTWYVSQWYGNTVWSHRNGGDLYSLGQGIHFGVDFAAPCGTEVVAVGDGVVHAVDGPYGSDPHNVVIRHDNGYYSLYGHLGQRSSLTEGRRIARGDRVGQVGDPAGSDCRRAPHLHLEIRTDGMSRTTNPVPLINADWRRLTIGAATEGTGFAVDFRNPGRWQSIHDQPDIRFGETRLNDYVQGWTIR